MITKEIAALMALRVYDLDVQDYNLPVDPVGWSKLPDPLPVQDGFAYGVFQNATKEIVISYRGTDSMMGPDGLNDVGLVLGSSSSQAIQAAKVYAAVMKTYGTDITFTGHSLGGGLASLMAVFFDRPAIVFDPAPFEAVAENIYAVTNIRDSLGEALPEAFSQYKYESNFLIREARVTSFHAVGEVLESLRNALNTIYGVNTPVQFGNEFMGLLGSRSMHSQLLLTAGLLSDSFRQATVQVPASLPLILSKSFYSQEPENSSTRNFLVDLVRSEQVAPGGSKLTHFAADLNKLGGNMAGLNRQAQDALIAQGIEWYYWQSNDYAGQEFFSTNGGALQYTTAKGADLPGAQNKAASYVGAWLYPLLAQSAVGNNLALRNIGGLYQEWTVATTSGAVASAKDVQKTQVFVGSSGSDIYTGGEQGDLLLGAAGSDTLSGGTGEDELYGGAGADSYLFSGQFGKDVVWDADGQGFIQIDGQTIGEAKGAGQRNVWSARLDDGQFVGLAVFDDSTSSTGKKLVVTRAGNIDNTITINNFDLARARGNGGYLGIRLGDTKLIVAANGASAASPDTNPFQAWDFDPDTFTGSTTTSNGKSFTIYLNQAAKPGTKLVLRLGELAGQQIKAILGDEEVDADGATITLTEGQTEVSFALKEGDGQQLAADVTGSFTVAFESGEGTETATSNPWRLTWKATPEPVHTFTGDIVKKRDEESGQYIFDESHNYVADGAHAGAEDLFRGTAEADSLAGGAGNDLLGGNGGDDLLEGGEGVDILLGGLGADVLLGGAGMDILMGSAPAPFKSPGNDDWRVQMPEDADYPYLVAEGFNWRFKAQGDPTSARWPNVPFLLRNIIPEQLADDAGNQIDAGAGDDIVYAGTGDDIAEGGDGRDLVYGMAGADVLEGDDGDDILLGDGPTVRDEQTAVEGNFAAFHTPGDRHGADFLDGGAGNDELAGQGQGDDMFGGAGDDTLWGDDFKESPVEGRFHGNDYLDGEDGDDSLYGGGQDDVLYGGAGRDQLWGDTEQSDTIDGTFHGEDYLDGEADDDVLYGGGKNDLLFGGEGNDTLWGDDPHLDVAPEQFHGQDYLDGEDGDDKLVGGAQADELFGGAGNDVLRGDSSGEDQGTSNASDPANHGDDYLDGEDGDDELIGEGGNDELYGAAGNDKLDGGRADDTLFGGADNDQLRGDSAELAGESHGADYVDGGEGDDTMAGDGGDDVLYGGSGNDGMLGDSDTAAGQYHGQDFLDGEDGDDVLYGGGGADVLIGGLGNDQMHGDSTVPGQYHAADDLDGGDGDDTLVGGGAADVIRGGAGNDALFGDGDVDASAHGSDILEGGDGDDSLVGDGGDDLLAGESGNDRLWGGEGADQLSGAAGDDMIQGGNGNDVLLGGGGNDSLEGGAGDDLLEGGAGSDVLVAGSGNDTLRGGEGFDEFLIRGDSGNVTVLDATGDDVVSFGAGVSLKGLTGTASDGTVNLQLPGGQTLTASDNALFLVGSDLLTAQQLLASQALSSQKAPAGQPGTTLATVAGGGGCAIETFTTDGSTGLVYQPDGGYTSFDKDTNGQEIARYYTWDDKLVASSVKQTQGFNSITTYRSTAGVKLAETWVHADGTTGTNSVGSSDLRYNGMQNVAQYSPARTATGYMQVDWSTEDASGRIWHDSDGRAYGTYWNVDGIQIGGRPYVAGGHDFEAANGRVTIGFSNVWAGEFTLEGVYVPHPFPWWGTLAEYYFMDKGAGVQMWGELSRSGQKSVYGERWVNGTQAGTTLLATSSSVQTPTETTMQGGNGYASLVEDGLGNAIFTSFGAAGEPRGLVWFHNDGSNGVIQYQPDGSSQGVTSNPQGTLFSFVTDAHGTVQFTGHPGAEAVWRDRVVEAPSVTTLAPPASLNLPPASSYPREPHTRLIPDGEGGVIYLDYRWNGSFTKTRYDPDGRLVKQDYVETDPGYGVSVAAGGAMHGWTYDYAGMPLSRYVRKADGEVETYTYDAQGRLSGRQVAITGIDGRVTIRRFDMAGSLTDFSVETTSPGRADTSHYEAAGALTGTTLKVADNDGNSATSHYDAAGALRYFTTTVATGPTESTITTYNPAGIALVIWVTSISPDGLIASHNYDAGGALIGSVLAQVDDSGKSTTGFYRADGKLDSYVVLESDAQYNTWVTTYNGQGRKTHEDKLQTDGVHIASTYEMDGSRLTTTVNPDGGFTTVARDSEGDETTTLHNAAGVKISDTWHRGDGTTGSHAYSADGSSSGKTNYADGSSSVTVMDAAGNSTTSHRAGNGALTGTVVTTREADVVRSMFYNTQGALLKELITPLGVSGTPIAVNHRPRSTGMVDHVASEDSAWTWTLPETTFTDADAGDQLTYTARLATGAALPSWLSFDPASRTFAGTPGNGNVGTAKLQVTAVDTQGAAVSDTFDLTVVNVNDAPTVVKSIWSTGVFEDPYNWSFRIYRDSFADADADDYLTLSASLADGSPLPAWLKFNASTLYFSGTPRNADVGNLLVKVTATDQSGANASTTFTLTVYNTNDKPVASGMIAAQEANGGEPFLLQLPADLFTDVDKDDALTWSVTQTDGAALPDWLSFDPATRILSGTPGQSDGGLLSLTVTVKDRIGASASLPLALNVEAAIAPTLAQPLPDQQAVEDQEWSFTVPTGSFAGASGTEVLAYSASQANGVALPAWLNFDGSTRTFHGVPGNAEVGTIAVTVTASNPIGQASDEFLLQVANTNDTPVVAQAVAAQEAVEDQVWTFTVPAGAFADVDVDDAMQLSATLAGGAPLPGWLQFNAATGTFTGVPLNDYVGKLRLLLVATDAAGASAGQEFDLTVANVNDAPAVALPMGAQEAVEDQGWMLTVPPATFADVDAGDRLSLSASLPDGSELPEWLHFNAATGTFSGTPLNEDVGTLSLRLTATDMEGASASTSVELNILNTNDAPVAVGELPDWSVRGGSADTYTVRRASFSDQDIGDTLTLSASLANGSALPAWLRFDLETLTLSGVPAAADAGMSTLRVTATDSAGTSAALEFKLTVGAIVIGGPGKDSLRGTVGDDLLDGRAGADAMSGGAGNDLYLVDSGGDSVIEATDQGHDVVNASTTYTLAANVEELALLGDSDINATGNGADNILRGNAGANQLRGAAGNDTLEGGRGADRLDGGAGDDVFVFGRGDGSDTVVEDDVSAGNMDTALFGPGIGADQLWFRRNGNHLQVSVVGTQDALVFQHWFKDPAHRVEVFRTSDDRTLLESQVQSLVDAMAAFSPPAAGQTTLPDSYQQTLGGAIAANWSHAA